MLRSIGVLALVALCAACAGGSRAAAPSGRVAGRVVVSECCGPAGTAGVRTESHLNPVPRVLLVITRRTPGRAFTRRLRTDADGRFDVRLPPGCYTVVARIRPSVSPGTGVCVRAGENARVAVTERVLVL